MNATNEHGYGVFRIIGKQRNVKAHRAAYSEFIAPISGSECVLHRCDIPACCNPFHLFIGTKKDNGFDCASKGRTRNQKKTHCDNGHEFNSENTYYFKGGKNRRCRACRKKSSAERYLRKKNK
jgi:hypothetical protein